MDKDVERVLDAARALLSQCKAEEKWDWGCHNFTVAILGESIQSLARAMEAFEWRPDEPSTYTAVRDYKRKKHGVVVSDDTPPPKTIYPMDVLLPGSRTQALKGLVGK